MFTFKPTSIDLKLIVSSLVVLSAMTFSACGSSSSSPDGGGTAGRGGSGAGGTSSTGGASGGGGATSTGGAGGASGGAGGASGGTGGTATAANTCPGFTDPSGHDSMDPTTFCQIYLTVCGNFLATDRMNLADCMASYSAVRATTVGTMSANGTIGACESYHLCAGASATMVKSMHCMAASGTNMCVP
jgi:hypothetical protein